MPPRPEVSVVIPMYNEEENVEAIVTRLKEALEPLQRPYEIVLVNDGSTDQTLPVARQVADREPSVTLVSYPANRGRGKAMRTGFAHAAGEFICTTEADLSYGEDIIRRMVAELREHPDLDMIVASPYMPGGGFRNVPWMRAMVSRVGNRILGVALPGHLTTMTGMTRAYRRHVLDSMELESDGKELHVEILSKALALGYTVKEIPATLTWRTRGKSKFKFRRTASSHLVLTFLERPMMLFGVMGLLLLLGGLLIGGYLAYQVLVQHYFNLERPFTILLLLLILAGTQILSLGFLGTQLTLLRKEIYKTQRGYRELLRRRQENTPARPTGADAEEGRPRGA